jgi:hypothetical protein
MPISGDGDIVGTIGDDNTIILSGEVPNGTYIFKYENADGTYSEIGTLAVGGIVEYLITTTLTNCTGASDNAAVIEKDGTVTLTFTANKGYVLPEQVTVSGAVGTWNMETGTLVLSNPIGDVAITIAAAVYTPYTNVLPLAQEYATAKPYVDATTGAIGYGENRRISGSVPEATYMKTDGGTGVYTTGLIPVKRGDIIRFKNCNFKVTPTNMDYGSLVYGFDSDKAMINVINLSSNKVVNITNRVPANIENGEYVQITLEPKADWNVGDAMDRVAYIMISTNGLTNDSIITINQEITE